MFFLNAQNTCSDECVVYFVYLPECISNLLSEAVYLVNVYLAPWKWVCLVFTLSTVYSLFPTHTCNAEGRQLDVTCVASHRRPLPLSHLLNSSSALSSRWLASKVYHRAQLYKRNRYSTYFLSHSLHKCSCSKWIAFSDEMYDCFEKVSTSVLNLHWLLHVKK